MSDNFRFAQLQPFSLAGAGAVIGDTSVVIKSMLDIDGTALTMTGTFGTIGYGTIDPGNGELEEQISFTGLTNNANGTTTLTGVSSVTFVYPYTATSGLSKTHAGSSTFVISNTSGFYDQLTSKDDDETISGLWTFEQNPQKDGVLVPTLDAEYATKKYVDDTATGTTNVGNILMSGTISGSITAGNIVYQLDSGNGVNSGKWIIADASTTAPLGKRLGVSQTTATNGQTINVLTYGLDTNQSGLSATKGTSYFLSNTPGTLATTPGTYTIFIGRNNATTQIIFDPVSNTDTMLISGATNYVTSTGSANAYVTTYVPALKALVAGQEINFKANFTNTGAVTVNPNGLGATAVKKLDGATALTSSDIVSGLIVKARYDGTNFQMLNPVGNTPGTQGGSETYAVDAGSANTYTATLAPIAGTYTAGMMVKVKIANTSTGASTLNVNGLGAKSIKKIDGATAITKGDLIAGSTYVFVYDGTNFVVQVPVNTAAGVLNNGATATTTITTGFKPRVIRFNAVVALELNGGTIGGSLASSWGTYSVSGSNCTKVASNAAAGTPVIGTNNAAVYEAGYHIGTVGNLTDTGFDLTDTRSTGSSTVYITWEAQS